jgi:cell division GTPase FtsZ
MKLALVGVGQAGGKIVDAFVDYQNRTNGRFVAAASAINTAESDLRGLTRVPEEHRTLIGAHRVSGHGVGADNELGAEIARDSREEILGALDEIPVHEIDAFLVVAGLGGGTGSGAAPVIARNLGEIYAEPVYGLGVLPAKNEGGIYSYNAARSLKTFVRQVDNLLVFDNDAWRKSGETVQESYEEINDEIAKRFGTLFSAGEVDAASDVGESVVDASEVINTLSGGGVTTVGYAAGEVPKKGLLSRFMEDGTGNEAEDVDRITSLVRRAARGRLTLPAEIGSADRALLVVAGPPDHLSRQGIERGRGWLEDETGSMQVRGGDYPLSSDHVAAVVMLAGVSEIPRIEELQQLAIETEDATEVIEEESEKELEALLEDEEDQLDQLF